MEQQPVEQSIIKPGLELTPFNAEAEIQKFPFKPEDLVALASGYASLTINGLTDKEGYLAVSAARKALKATRVEITGVAKDVREGAIKFQKLVINKEKELVGLIAPTEEALEQKEKAWEKLKEDAALEEERKKTERIQSMLDKLSAVEFAVDIFDLQAMSDEQFDVMLVNATADFEVTKIKREEERLAKEEADRLAEALRKEEQVRLEEQRLKQEAAQKKFDEEQAAFRDEQERVRKENEEREAKIKAEQQALVDQQALLKQQRTKARDERLKTLGMFDNGIGMVYKHPHNPGQVLCGRAHILGLTDEGFEEHFQLISNGVERFRLEGEANKQRVEAEAAAAKLIREEEEKKERELRMSDGQRFELIRESLQGVVWMTFASTWGKMAAERVQALINEAIEVCKANETSEKL